MSGVTFEQRPPGSDRVRKVTAVGRTFQAEGAKCVDGERKDGTGKN